MGLLRKIAYAVSGLSTTTFIADVSMTGRVFNSQDKLCSPPTASIILPTFREEKWVRTALESLRNQNLRREYPERFEVIVVDSGSEDSTVEIAREYAKVFDAPRGKLTARHIGIGKARGEVILGVDADCYYAPNWLNLMLRHFKDPDVVGVGGPRLLGHVFGDSNVIYDIGSVWSNIQDGVGNTMYGSNGAFLKQAYYEADGFDLDIDQFNAQQMMHEEEHYFPFRLKRLGRVVWDWQATVFSSARRHYEGGIKRSFAQADYVLLYPS